MVERRLVRWVAGAALPVALLLGGCTPSGQAAARIAGNRFQAALSADDPNDACQLLSEEARGNLESASGKPCAAALAGLDLPTGMSRSIELRGDNGRVRLESGVLFLAKFQAGWKGDRGGLRAAPRHAV